MYKKSFILALLASAIHVFGAGLDQKSNMVVTSPVRDAETGAWDLAGVSVDADLNFSRVNWKLDSASHSDTAVSPQIGLSYAINQMIAPRLTVKYFSVSDDNSDLDVWCIGLGGRFWLPIDCNLVPFVGGTLNYYDLSLNQTGHVNGAGGLTGEAGVGYFFNDNFCITLNVSAETSLIDGQATIANRDEDISLNALSVGVGINARF
jgi:outer membrane protein W